ncbi:aKG-HExxH-type peptide beta-hydroxylase [Sorangium sp. So ce693]|uniref:aKG-HExxH-type peptide beta-hydroxylase n=1 Tax=Sorangium sp. So ce693 TaxID=3133318 RepID=UPI003F61C2CA
MSFSLPGIGREEFFRDYWRKRPLFIKGGALHLLERPVEEAELDEAFALLETVAPAELKRSGDEVIFGPRIDRVVPRLRAIAGQLHAEFGCTSIGFDGIKAKDGHSIGSHFDTSDNFVLQQWGTKIWRLHAPDFIPQEIVRQRMLHAPDVGSVFMPEDALEYTLEPGDLLYIPILWAHWGVSRGPSTSVSLLFNSESGAQLMPLLTEVLSLDQRFWSPMPTAELTDFSDPSPAMPAGVKAWFASIGEALRDPVVIEEVERRFWRARARRIRILAGVEAEAAPAPAPAKDELHLDMDRVRSLLQAPLPRPDLGRLVLPETETRENQKLRECVYRPYLKRLLLTCTKAYPLLRDPAHKRSLATLVSAFMGLKPADLRETVLGPELTSWIWRMAEAIDFDYPPRVELIVRHLGSFLLPVLLANGVLPEGEPLLLAPSGRGELHLFFPVLRALEVPLTLPEVLPVVREGGALRVGGERPFEVSVTALLGQERPARGDVTLSPLPTAPGGRVLLMRTTGWYTEFFPKREDQGRVSPLHLDITDAELDEFRASMTRGLGLVRELWPAAHEELEEGIRLVLPVRSLGLDPHNGSVAGFRGLITSSARPDYMIAQTLVHETAHNKLSSILDVFRLATNPDDELHPSPFVPMPRPMSALFHGAFSFIQDLHMTRRMLNGGVPSPPEAPMEKYLQKIEGRVKMAIGTILRRARLTPEGDAIVAGMERALAV